MSEYFPVEVMVEILKRLPLKSVVKCRSVCKSWKNLIKTPSFISTHLQTSLSKPHNHLLLHKCVFERKEIFSLHFDNDDFDEFRQLHFRVPENDELPFFLVVGYCNGLVCFCRCLVSTNMFELTFWNPSIKKYIVLPKPIIIPNGFLIFGFGFDSRTNDCKVLVVLIGKGEISSEAYLFSLNENSWKRVTARFPEYAMERVIPSIFVNGAFHWLGYQREQDGGFRNVILGFDITIEDFFVLRLPESLIGLPALELSIIKCEESVGVLRENNELLELWVMKKYGVETWSKVLHLTEQGGRIPKVLGFRKNGEVLLEDGVELASLDLNCQQMKHLGVQGEYGFIFGDSYVESLVLLDKGVDANHANDSSGSDACSEEESEIA